MAGLDFEERGHSFARASNAEWVEEDEEDLQMYALLRLPTTKRMNLALMRKPSSELLNSSLSESKKNRMEQIDVRKLNRIYREHLVKDALATNEQDNYKLLSAIKERFKRVGLEVPSIEVKFRNLKIGANVKTGTRALPTLINYTRDALEGCLNGLGISKPKRHSLTILNDINGVIKPGRMTLLLGPPGSGKTTLLLALAGKLDKELKTSGSITYNGEEQDQFCIQRASAYISQVDNHTGELTVRETFDFANRCQGSSDAELLKTLESLEKEKKVLPSPEIDAFMKATSVGGKRHNVMTDYILKVLGLDVCADTVVGSDMIRGISGGQKKRVTTGEMIVGPRKALFMDEISTGLDSSTTFQIVKCLRNFVHQMEATVLMALLQPAPETFELFDDLILLSDGYIVYQGPVENVVEFFESLSFKLPPRKGVADFLQEVTSKKDQAQYWADSSKPYKFISVPEITEAFRNSKFGKSMEAIYTAPYDKSKSPSTLPKSNFAVSSWNLFKACLSRELTLLNRNRFLYIFRTCQVALVGIITSTMFLQIKNYPKNEEFGILYQSALFYALVHMLFNGTTELSLLIIRLPVFYSQRGNLFYPAWTWTLSSWLLQVPYSIVEAVVWTCVVYYSIGFAPSVGRFGRYMLLLLMLHQMALSLFRFMASIGRDMIIGNTAGAGVLMILFLLGGFIVPLGMIKPWWVWAYWLSPLNYAQRAVSVNEFTATRWMQPSAFGKDTVGHNILRTFDLPVEDYWYWISMGILLVYTILFNILTTWALACLNPLKEPRAIIENEDEDTEKSSDRDDNEPQKRSKSTNGENKNKGLILPFQPLTMTFHNVNYYVDMPKALRQQGVTETRLKLLANVSGVFAPGVLTALMGSSGAGKTTLMDVLAGRKTGGYIEGDVKISGYPKVQHTFARIAGYVEQNDIHSPEMTVQESLWFSASLRLPKDVTKEKKQEFVEQVMKLVELESLRNAIVGMPGTSGLSTEQRKRLTIAVELVANPSIIFMDEPTSGLDARAAAIVMRTVRNTVDTGRTVVCTIHQPSIDIFEAFDELLLMKRGGQVIYGGKIGNQSSVMISYFQSMKGISPISSGYNPATWMLEVTTPAIEEKIGVDFADVYDKSDQFKSVEAAIKQYEQPSPGSKPLKFDTLYSQNTWSQFVKCLWKQRILYWRNPPYNAIRMIFTILAALVLGSIFWQVGAKRETTQQVLVIMGALFSSLLFLGVKNASSVQPVVSTERTVFYREKAAGMYSPIAFAAAQGLVEIPYQILQTIVFGVITYFMMGFDNNLRKFILYLVFMFLTFTYFTFYGIMCVGLTPTLHLSAVASSAFYSLWNLVAGFIIPKVYIPKYWLWFHYLCPVSWTLRGVITSQFGDMQDVIVGPGFKGTVKEYIAASLGYEDTINGVSAVGVSAIVLIVFTLFFFATFAVSVRVLNFQSR
ncbi:ABC transporter G family member 31 isoform X2 [Lathyrus oleraceus]|uniref:ABC transporter G member 31 n=1 Tax=Pisum sativum TaxID=3888 RepID=A0A9D4WTA3_PEA|nr:ABC transporter G family member 31-like isoform X2 [Pisum sativum]KAI5408719.1 ABC transporter G member 31 [Pisum sativum]